MSWVLRDVALKLAAVEWLDKKAVAAMAVEAVMVEDDGVPVGNRGNLVPAATEAVEDSVAVKEVGDDPPVDNPDN